MDKDFNFLSAKRLNAVKEAQGLKDFFSVKVEISIFGHVFWSYTYPPKKNAL